MKHLSAVLLLLICGSLCTPSYALAEKATAALKVLYVYGSVSNDGTVPAGETGPFQQMRLDDTSRLGMSKFAEALRAVHAEPDEAYDGDVTFNKATLSKYDVVILASNQRQFRPDEAKAFANWVRAGGGLIVWSDSAFGGNFSVVGLDNSLGRDSDNLITEQFGMHFLTDNGGGNYLISHFTEDHYLNAYNKNGGVRFRGEGVSLIRVSKPARVLAKLDDGGLGGKLYINKIDGVFNRETDAALAVAEIGKGRVIGVFDRNAFWNAGDGSRITQLDNREYAQRLVIWAGHREKSSFQPSPRDHSAPAHSSPMPRAVLSVASEVDGDSTSLVANFPDVTDDGDAPALEWQQVSGPAPVEFENNNRFTPTARVGFTKSGEYRFILLLDNGETRATYPALISVKLKE